MVELILHPGHPKCGSTSIQRALIRNRKQLESKGVFFPDNQFLLSFEPGCNLKADTPRLYFKNIHACDSVEGLTDSLKQLEERVLKILEIAEKHNCHKLIVSAENLINRLGGPFGQKIHQLFAKYFSNVKVLYFFRSQEDFILSSWQQWSHKEGVTLESYVKKSLSQSIPNYANTCRFLSKTYGKENLKVIPLNKNLLYGGSLIKEFMLGAGIDTKGLNVREVVFNETLNPYLCDILSSMSDVYTSIHDPTVKTRLLKFTNNSSVLRDKAPQFLPLELRKKIREHFQQHNRNFHKEFLGQYEYQAIFAPKFTKEPSPYDRETQMREIIKVLTKSILDSEVSQ